MDGIAGVYGMKDPELVNKAFLATAAGQHRGEASTGLAIGTRKGIYVHKSLGRIADVVDASLVRGFQDLEPTAAIGNIGDTQRTGAETTNAEPIEIRPRKRSKYSVVLTMDGYLVREDDLKADLEGDYIFETDNKTEVVGALLHKFINKSGIYFETGQTLVERC